MPHRVIVRRTGHRGELMILLGLIWCLIGVGILSGASDPSPDQGLWHLVLPEWLRATLWVTTGVGALYGGLDQRWSTLGLAPLVIMPAVRVTSYAWSWVLHLVPGRPDGFPDGWYSAVFYALMLGFVIAAAHAPARATVQVEDHLLPARIRKRLKLGPGDEG